MTAPPQESGAYVVTLKDVWHEVADTKDRTAAALEKMSAAVSDLAGRLSSITEALRAGTEHRQDLEMRVRGLERWRYQLPISLGASVIALAAVVIDAISRIR